MPNNFARKLAALEDGVVASFGIVLMNTMKWGYHGMMIKLVGRSLIFLAFYGIVCSFQLHLHFIVVGGSSTLQVLKKQVIAFSSHSLICICSISQFKLYLHFTQETKSKMLDNLTWFCGIDKQSMS